MERIPKQTIARRFRLMRCRKVTIARGAVNPPLETNARLRRPTRASQSLATFGRAREIARRLLKMARPSDEEPPRTPGKSLATTQGASCAYCPRLRPSCFRVSWWWRGAAGGGGPPPGGGGTGGGGVGGRAGGGGRGGGGHAGR